MGTQEQAEHGIDFEIPGEFIALGYVGGGSAPVTGRYEFTLKGFRVSGMADKNGCRYIEPEVTFNDAGGFDFAVRGERSGSLRWPWTNDGGITPELRAMDDETQRKTIGAIMSEHVNFALAFGAGEGETDRERYTNLCETGVKLTDLVGSIGYGEWLEPLSKSAPTGFTVDKNMRYGRVERWLTATRFTDLEAKGVPVADGRERPWGNTVPDDADGEPDEPEAETEPAPLPKKTGAKGPSAVKGLPTSTKKGLAGKAR